MTQSTAHVSSEQGGALWAAREWARALYHLALYTRHLTNGFAVWRLRHDEAAMPELRFRNGSVWHHGPNDEPLFVLREIYGKGLYPALDRHSAGHVVDIGANIGAVTIHWAKARPDLRFHAYEPNPQALETLRRNIEANGLRGQVEVHGEAVGGEAGVLSLWIDVPTAHSTAFGDSPAPGGRRFEAPMVTLDEVWERCGRGGIAMLKIDAEGGEVEMLERASADVLAAVRVASIEYHDNLVPGAYDRCRKVLDRAGFVCSVYEHPWEEGVITAVRS